MPHLLMERNIVTTSKRYGLSIFVEAGTYLGDMVDAIRRNFEQVYSIEVSQQLCKKARTRFRKNPNVTILEGSSSVVLSQLIPTLQRPTLFWLDHYCDDPLEAEDRQPPVLSEISTILEHMAGRFVILSSSAHLFGTYGLPTVHQVKDLVADTAPNMKLLVENDILRITPTV
ncbi:MAG: hypothetical protein JOY62_11780 [Acidobacteriaceae bacterium]|nr:hypothetical protein [Acidobacteriaceae bacterium]MBV9780640.1 hypothetical protein [Acidobacteriaceae bacterium]